MTSHPPACFHRWLLAALLLPALAGQAPAPVDPPYQLDPMVVTALAPPIVKEAEYPVLEPRFGAAAVAEGHYLYVIGGSNTEGMRLDSIERVDLRTGRAERWAKLRIARRHHRAVIADGSIYVLGGTSGQPDPEKPLIEELAEYEGDEPPAAAYHRPPAQVSRPPYEYESTVEIVNLATGRVELGPRMPVAKSMFGCVVVNGQILVIGGQKRKGAFVFSTNTTEVFDLRTRTWSTGVNMPTPRRCTAALVDGFVMVVGGYRGARPLPTVEVFNPRDGGWRRLPDLAEPVNPASTVWEGNHLLLFGDQEVRQRQLAYDLRSKQLAAYPLPLPDSDFAAALKHNGRIYVAGGASLRRHEATAGLMIFTPVASPAVGGDSSR